MKKPKREKKRRRSTKERKKQTRQYQEEHPMRVYGVCVVFKTSISQNDEK